MNTTKTCGYSTICAVDRQMLFVSNGLQYPDVVFEDEPKLDFYVEKESN